MDENYKGKDIKFTRRVRPRYNKLLIPALIISLIIAVILILILKKYLFQPIFEEKGLLHPSTPVLVMQSGNVLEERIPLPKNKVEVKAIP